MIIIACKSLGKDEKSWPRRESKTKSLLTEENHPSPKRQRLDEIKNDMHIFLSIYIFIYLVRNKEKIPKILKQVSWT